MNSISKLVDLIKMSNINEVGDVTLFGSFIKTKGKCYNDIDIYVNSPSDNIEDIIKKLASFPFRIRVTPQYYRPYPLPTPPIPKPNSPKPFNREYYLDNHADLPLLHITVASKTEAKQQDFYSTMKVGSRVVIHKDGSVLKYTN